MASFPVDAGLHRCDVISHSNYVTSRLSQPREGLSQESKYLRWTSELSSPGSILPPDFQPCEQMNASEFYLDFGFLLLPKKVSQIILVLLIKFSFLLCLHVEGTVISYSFQMYSLHTGLIAELLMASCMPPAMMLHVVGSETLMVLEFPVNILPPAWGRPQICSKYVEN